MGHSAVRMTGRLLICKNGGKPLNLKRAERRPAPLGVMEKGRESMAWDTNMLRIGIQFFAEETTPAESGNEDDGYGLFDDYTEGAQDTNASGEGQAEDEEKEHAADQTPGETDAAQDVRTQGTERFKVVHLGEEKELTRDEMIAYAQKGMDYDHVRNERDQLRHSPEFEVLDKMAKASGMTRAEYIARIREMERAEEQRGIENQIRDMHPDAPDDLISETARLRQQAAEAEKRSAEEQKARAVREAAEQSRRERQQKEMREFIEAYPDMRDFKKEIPAEVWERVRGGESLLSAYRAHENAQLKAKIAAMEKSAENRGRAVGSVRGEGNGESDDFLAGFLGL